MADTKPPDNRGDVDPRLYGAEPRGDTAKAGDAREGVSHFVMITYRPHIQGKYEYPVWERRPRKGGAEYRRYVVPVTIVTWRKETHSSR